MAAMHRIVAIWKARSSAHTGADLGHWSPVRTPRPGGTLAKLCAHTAAAMPPAAHHHDLHTGAGDGP